MEIAPSVHAVPTLGATAYLICERRLTLIDAGLHGSRRRLVRYLRPLGRSLDELDRIEVSELLRGLNRPRQSAELIQ